MLGLLGSVTMAWALRGDDPQVTGQARTTVRQALCNMPAPLVDDALVVASELVTNATKYTRSNRADGLIAMGITVADKTVTITVLDEGPLNGSVPTVLPEGRIDSGLGLGLCAMLGDFDSHPIDGAGFLVSVALNVKETAR
jgi:anti-sigma regulatory factor (Ser/Thr protein kinase)